MICGNVHSTEVNLVKIECVYGVWAHVNIQLVCLVTHDVEGVHVCQYHFSYEGGVATALVSVLLTVPHLPSLQILKREESVDGGVEDDKEGQVKLQDPVIKKNAGSCCRRS